MSSENHDEPSGEDDQPSAVRPMPETLVFRALRLRCPRCGKGKLFKGWFRMNDRCPKCGFLIERTRGYYLGSIYINYGATAWLTIISFMIGRLYLRVPAKPMGWILGAFCLIFPMFFFRYSRALWLALDCQFDASVLDDRSQSPPADHKADRS